MPSKVGSKYHRKDREKLKKRVDAGVESCVYCHRPIASDEPWHLAHDHSIDPDDPAAARSYLGAAHPGCNTREMSDRTRPQRRRTSRRKAVRAWSRNWIEDPETFFDSLP